MNKVLLCYSLAVQAMFGLIAVGALLLASLAMGNLLALGLAIGACAALCVSHAVQADWLVFSILRESGGYVSGEPCWSPRWARWAYIATFALAILAWLALALIR